MRFQLVGYFKNIRWKKIIGITSILVLFGWLTINWNGHFRPINPVGVIDLSIFALDLAPGEHPYKVLSNPGNPDLVTVEIWDDRFNDQVILDDAKAPPHWARIKFDLKTLRESPAELYTVPWGPRYQAEPIDPNAAYPVALQPDADGFFVKSELLGFSFFRIGIGGDITSGFLGLRPAHTGIARLVMSRGDERRTMARRFIVNADSQYYADDGDLFLDPHRRFATLWDERAKKLYVFKGPFFGD